MRHQEDRRWPWLTVVIVTVVAIGLSAILWAWREPLWAVIRDEEDLRSWVAKLGPWGPIATMGLNVLQVILAPIPGQFVGVMNGYLYGIVAGSLYSIVGLVIGTAAALVGLGPPQRRGRWPGVALLALSGGARRPDGTTDSAAIGVNQQEKARLEQKRGS